SPVYSFYSTAPPPTAIYTLSLHDALPICARRRRPSRPPSAAPRGRARNCAPNRVRAWLDHRPRDRLADSLRAPVRPCDAAARRRSEEHTSELQSRENLVCRLLLEKKKITE